MCSHDVDLLDTEINWRPRLASSGANVQSGDCGEVPAFEALTVRTRIANLFILALRFNLRDVAIGR